MKTRLNTAWQAAKKPLTWLARLSGIGLALVAAFAIGGLVQKHLRTSKAFAIDQLEVSGMSHLTRDQVLAAAGLHQGLNIFELSPDQVQGRLEAHPWIGAAEVSRRLPGRYEISIREVHPIALLAVEACSERSDAACDDAAQGLMYLVSDEGTVFKEVGDTDPVDLPVITGVDRERLTSDSEFRAQVLVDAVALLRDYDDRGLSKRMAISELHVEGNGGFSLYAGPELTLVRLGNPPFDQKLLRMRRVLDRLEREKVSAAYVYLDNEERPDRVTVRLR